MVRAGWRIESWAFSCTWISHTIHLYADRTAVVRPLYQQKPLWFSKQTFVSSLCCHRRDNEATGTCPAKPRLSCSLKTSLFTTSRKPSHLVKDPSQPITAKSIASVITLIWGQRELFVYSFTCGRHWGGTTCLPSGSVGIFFFLTEKWTSTFLIILHDWKVKRGRYSTKDYFVTLILYSSGTHDFTGK